MYLSLGFEYRIGYKNYHNWMFGAPPQDPNGYVLKRVIPHFDFHLGSDFRCSPVRHTIIALNFAGFRPGTFFNTVTYHASPIAANVGFTYRF
jgi:hypothetical protein